MRDNRGSGAALLHFEDFAVGRVFDCGAYEVTQDEIFAFAREFDPQPHHLDEAAAERSLLKGLSASGWQTCAIAMRMLADGVLLKAACCGGAGSRETCWLKPLRPGDVLHMEARVMDARPSHTKPFGFVTFDCNLSNARGQVALVSMTPLIEKRPA